MRDGAPLPATTPDAVLSQLAHRVFGPVHRDRVRSMLDYHGLAGHPAEPIPRIAARYGVHPATISNWAGVLKAAGSRLPLPEDLIAQISRRSTIGEDDRARTRIATTLGLPPPAPPDPTSAPPPRHPRTRGSAEDRADALIALRVLATAGPQTLDTLLGAVGRVRRSRYPSATRLATMLNAHGAAVDDRRRWQAPANQWTSPQYRALAASVSDRTLTHTEMLTALAQAGYTRSYAERAISVHPLIRRVGPNAYRLIGH
jgi:hypothetical protein